MSLPDERAPMASPPRAVVPSERAFLGFAAVVYRLFGGQHEARRALVPWIKGDSAAVGWRFLTIAGKGQGMGVLLGSVVLRVYDRKVQER